MVDILLAEITGTDIALIQAGSNAVEEFFDGQVSVYCNHFQATNANVHAAFPVF